ncbi:hypothetical protein LRY65_00505 [Candidatus Woesebacteria bacterium]|nr:hypothetical protein [Candidatus Woesebacteria bacterium]
MQHLHHKLSSGILTALAFLAPIWFIPLIPDSIGVQKQFLFMVTAIALAAFWIVRVVREKRVLFSLSPVNISALLLVVATVISAVMASNTPFQLSGRFLSLLAMSVVLLFGFSTFSGFRWSHLLRGLTWGTAALSIVVWWQLVVPGDFTFSALLNRFLGSQLPTNISFSLAESPAVLLALLVPVVLANGISIWKHFSATKKETSPESEAATSPVRLGLTAFLFATLAGVLISIVLKPDVRPVLLPYQFGWGIAIENWKQLPRLLFGIGPESFLSAFHRFRDVTYNMSELWALRFRASSSEALHALTTIGAVGFTAWLGVYASGLWTGRQVFRKHPTLFVFFLIQILLFWVAPLSATTIIVLTLTLLAIMEEARAEDPTTAQDLVVLLSAIQLGPSGQLKSKKTHAGFAYATAAVFAAGALALTYFAGKTYAAEYLYARSILSAQNNQVTNTYDLQQLAIRFSPYNTQYRRSYSSTNLAIARGLAQNGDLTEEQRQVFAQLLQQSIREARMAAQINPTETENWEHLSSLYSNMLDVEGSSRWATAAPIQAIQTDPLSPQLRAQLGNLYVVLNQPDQSLRYYEQAIQLKPDWHVAYYRYGVALMAMEQPGLATQAFQRALSLLEESDDDFVLVQGALTEAQNAAAAQQSDGNADDAAGTYEAGSENADLLDTPQQPSVPENAPAQNPNDPSFDELLESDPLQEQPQPESTEDQTPNEGTQNSDGSIVLPENVGF